MNREDLDYLRQFERCTLDPASFDHRAHLRVAWLYLQTNDLESACSKTCDGIRAFAASAGDPGKFHHTITEFLVRTMAGRDDADPAADFDGFVRRNQDLLADARGLIDRHYSRRCLESSKARTRWVEPDLAA